MDSADPRDADRVYILMILKSERMLLRAELFGRD